MMDIATSPAGPCPAHPHPAHRPLFARHPVLSSAAVGVATLLPHAVLTPAASLAYAAAVIAVVAGVYFGFAVANGSTRDQAVELSVAAMFATTGIVGLLAWPVLLPIAYFAHAAWDFAHHRRLRLPLVSIPQWYVPWCVVVDVIVGFGLLIVWRGHGFL